MADDETIDRMAIIRAGIVGLGLGVFGALATDAMPSVYVATGLSGVVLALAFAAALLGGPGPERWIAVTCAMLGPALGLWSPPDRSEGAFARFVFVFLAFVTGVMSIAQTSFVRRIATADDPLCPMPEAEMLLAAEAGIAGPARSAWLRRFGMGAAIAAAWNAFALARPMARAIVAVATDSGWVRAVPSLSLFGVGAWVGLRAMIPIALGSLAPIALNAVLWRRGLYSEAAYADERALLVIGFVFGVVASAVVCATWRARRAWWDALRARDTDRWPALRWIALGCAIALGVVLNRSGDPLGVSVLGVVCILAAAFVAFASTVAFLRELGLSNLIIPTVFAGVLLGGWPAAFPRVVVSTQIAATLLIAFRVASRSRSPATTRVIQVSATVATLVIAVVLSAQVEFGGTLRAVRTWSEGPVVWWIRHCTEWKIVSVGCGLVVGALGSFGVRFAVGVSLPPAVAAPLFIGALAGAASRAPRDCVRTLAVGLLAADGAALLLGHSLPLIVNGGYPPDRVLPFANSEADISMAAGSFLAAAVLFVLCCRARTGSPAGPGEATSDTPAA